jgi:hypothetical protein
MEIDGGLRMDSLVWLSSPRPGEKGWTGRLHEDVESACAQVGLLMQTYAAPSKALFLDPLDKIAKMARDGRKPFLHLDMHGSVEKGVDSLQSLKICECIRSGSISREQPAENPEPVKAGPREITQALIPSKSLQSVVAVHSLIWD